MLNLLTLLVSGVLSGFSGLPLPLLPNTTIQPKPPRNIVLIVADDFGVDLMSSYAEGNNLPCTPNLDTLATEGMIFRNAWATPMCSPARAQILTGRYGFRTGIGTPVGGNAQGLMLGELILPELLVGYDTAAVGKWHLSGSYGDTHPNDSGFGSFAGSRANLDDYDIWDKIENGQTSTSNTYATTDTANEAIEALLGFQGPWFLHVAFNAPHSPLHAPDSSFCASGCSAMSCANVDDNSPGWRKGRKMVSAMDAEIGRILDAVDAVDPNALVIFIGDNGTGSQVTRPPFLSDHAKGTVYEGGLNVPLVIRGKGVMAGSECEGLVSAVDIFATIAEVTRLPGASEDSISMVPYFTNPGLSLRGAVFSETFSPNHQSSLPFSNHERAVRNGTFKLIRRTGAPDEFFNLDNDQWEQNDLFPTLQPGSIEESNYFDLVAELAALGVD